MSVHSIQRKKRRDPGRVRYKTMGSHEEFLSRITKTLYYARLPNTDRFSLPVTELAAELFSEVKSGRSLDRLRLEEAAEITRNACVSPCSLVLAMLYLERLKICNPEYVMKVSSSDLFLVSSLVASKYLNDDGSEDEVFNSEWATSAEMNLKDLNKLEFSFLDAINWEVFVREGLFWEQLDNLERVIAFKEGRKRGWFSYTDLDKLLDNINSLALAQTVLSVSAVCLAAYTAGLLTVVGSTLLVANLPTPYSPLRTLAPTLPPPLEPVYNHSTLPEQVDILLDRLNIACSGVQEEEVNLNESDCPTVNRSDGCTSGIRLLPVVTDYISTVTRPFLPYIVSPC